VGELQGRAETQVTYDERSWPLVAVTMPARLASDAEFADNLRRMAAYGERGGPFGFVLDTRGSPDPDAKRRRDIAEFWDQLQRRYGSAFIGAAIVMSSPTGRAIFKAILWLRQGATPLVAVATPEAGFEELRKLARQSPQRT
jgi:hypothetical protein